MSGDLFPATTPATKPIATRVCDKCKGSGHRYRFAHETEDHPCFVCHGAGSMPEPNYTAIIAALKGRKGLASKRPADSRAYYVWRMARFHGGRDVTMPMTAMYDIEGDPWVKELDALADAVAKRAFGTHLAAAHRWGSALGMVPLGKELPGLPAAAYENGPVLIDGNKPEEEEAELR